MAGSHFTHRSTCEVAAALGTAVGHLATNAWGGHGVFIVVAIVAWAAYAVRRASGDRSELAAWGLRRADLRATWRATAPWAFVALAGAVAWGGLEGRLPPPATAYALIALYPVWGLVQQVLVQGFVVRHIDTWLGSRRRVATVLVGAVSFGLVHAPHWKLMAATSLFGLIATPVWLRHRNVWPLAVWHGVIGVAFYYFVLGRDPWLENFGP